MSKPVRTAERENVIISERQNVSISERQHIRTSEHRNIRTSERRNVKMPKRRKNISSLNVLNQLCPRQVPQAQVRESLQVRQVQQGGAGTEISAAESPDKYNIKARRRCAATAISGRAGATTTSRIPRFISICRCRFPIYPIIQACGFFDRLPDCQSFMIYFITLQGSFPQKNGVLIKILLRTRNNGRIIEINSTRKARKSIYPSRVKA